MLAHAIEETDFAALDPTRLHGGMEMGRHPRAGGRGRGDDGKRVARLYSRTGEDISKSFPDLVEALRLPGAIDGELLIVRDGRVQSFNVLQQRLNRKAVTPKLLLEFPAHLRAYDLLVDGDEDLRDRPFAERRARLEAFVARLDDPRIDLSPLVAVRHLGGARPRRAPIRRGRRGRRRRGGRRRHAQAPRRAYVPGRPKGLWWKWKRDPFIVDAVLMYAQRGHGKRSSYYSDYTFGVWTEGESGDELVPVGKAYFGFTDEELLQIDRFVRRNTIERFGPVREVDARAGQGPGVRGRVRGLAALDPAQVRPRHALSPHQPAALGQAAARGRPARDAGGHAAKIESGRGVSPIPPKAANNTKNV